MGLKNLIRNSGMYWEELVIIIIFVAICISLPFVSAAIKEFETKSSHKKECINWCNSHNYLMTKKNLKQCISECND